MDLLTDAEKAEAAFRAFIKALPPAWQSVETEAWENAFSVEVYNEYKDDAERWTVALETAKMLTDGAF